MATSRSSWWRDRQVVVTGGTGFLGRAVVRKLQQQQCQHTYPLGRDTGDFRERDIVRAMYAHYTPDIVIHLAAACGGIGANRLRPAEFLYDNLIMGAHLIDLGAQAGLEKFVGIGSVCAYPSATRVPFHEEDLWNGYPEPTNAPYGLAKRLLLAQLQAYRQQYRFNGIFLLPANLYGPADNFDLETSHVIPALIRKFVEARESEADAVTCWGTGEPSREFLYVDDAAEGIVLATQHYDGNRPTNLGTGKSITIRELAELIRDKTGFVGRIEWDASKPDGQLQRRLDTSKAKERFGFTAKTPLSEGLDATIAWYEREHRVCKA